MKKNHRKVRKIPRLGPAWLAFEGLDGQVCRRSVEYVTARLGVSTRTVNRWRHDRRIPPTPLLLLQLDAAGMLMPCSWQRRGARFNSDGSLSAGGYTFALGELEGYAVICQCLRLRERPERPADGLPRLTVLRGGLEDAQDAADGPGGPAVA